MRYAPVAAMFALLGLAATLLVLVVAKPEPAAAHLLYCGHSYRTFWRDLPMGMTMFREAYAFSSGVSPHQHYYRTFRWRPGHGWVFIHGHARTCPNTHPI